VSRHRTRCTISLNNLWLLSQLITTLLNKQGYLAIFKRSQNTSMAVQPAQKFFCFISKIALMSSRTETSSKPKRKVTYRYSEKGHKEDNERTIRLLRFHSKHFQMNQTSQRPKICIEGSTLIKGQVGSVL